jgi:hypothetical protein
MQVAFSFEFEFELVQSTSTVLQIWTILDLDAFGHSCGIRKFGIWGCGYISFFFLFTYT